MSNKHDAEIGRLQAKLASWENLREELGDAKVDAEKRGIETRLEALIQTFGGAFVAGSVRTGGSDFVGRDQVKTVYHQEGASVEDLLKLLREVRALLPQADLDPDVADVIAGDFRVVEEQAAKDPPKGGLIKTKLKSISEVVQETGKTSDAVEKILKLLGKGVALAGTLF